MLLLNLKIAFRNLSKHKLYTLLNIGGLAMGMLGFVLISLYINYEKTFDQWNPLLKNVYTSDYFFVDDTGPSEITSSPYPLMALLQQKAPEVKSVAMMGWGTSTIKYNNEFYSDYGVRTASSNLFEAYPHTAVAGNLLTALREPNGMVVSQSFAKNMFGSQNPLGKQIQLGVDNDKMMYTIKAVFDDKANRSHFDVDVFVPIVVHDWDHWGNHSYVPLIQLMPNADAAKAKAHINSIFLDAYARYSSKVSEKPAAINTDALLGNAQALDIIKKNFGFYQVKLDLLPLQGLRLIDKFTRISLQVLRGISILLMLIVCINFTNLSIVQAGKRAKEVGVRKILGSKKSALIAQFLIESLIPCVLALAIAMVCVELSLPSFNHLLNTQIDLYDAQILPILILQVMALLLIVILIAGLYPSLFISSFLPVKVLKGNFNRSNKGILVRKVLVVLQFGIASLFLICFGVMKVQLQYLKNRDIGMDKENILSVNISTNKYQSITLAQFAPLAARISQIKGVLSVSRYSNLICSYNNSIGDTRYKEVRGSSIDNIVEVDFVKAIGAKIVQGRDFSQAYFAADTSAVQIGEVQKVRNALVNETFVKTFKIKNPIGEIFTRSERSFKIVGVVKDINMYGANKVVSPEYYSLAVSDGSFNYVLIKTAKDANQGAVLNQVKALWTSEIEPGTPFYYTYAADNYDKSMKSQNRIATIMLLFSIVTFIITLLGIFALAAYTAKMRTREIAVRRVMGASVQDILLLLNKDFIKLVLIANAIAVAAAYLLMQKWLAQFPYKVAMPYWIFVGIAVLLLLVTIITVTLQGIQSARTKPVAALSYE